MPNTRGDSVMSDKSAQDLFNEMDVLWDNFKSATWNTMSDLSDTITLSTQQKNGK
jgi:hypothetical protein